MTMYSHRVIERLYILKYQPLSLVIIPYLVLIQPLGASIKIGPGKMGKDILNKTGKRGILDIVTGCPG